MANTIRPHQGRRTWFLTGATGFIGREVLRRILGQTNDPVILLVREKPGKSAEARVDGLLDSLALNTAKPRIRVCGGDTGAKQFGLGNALWRELAEHTTHILHLAALTRFDATLDQARRSNLDSARHMIEFADACKRTHSLKRMLHVSTAYVAGATREVVDCDYLDPQGRFRNSYEQSKCEAEAWVRNNMADLPITVARPAIVVGDSKTGEVTGFNTIYWSVRTYLRGVNIVFARTDASLDLVPVDYVADAVLHLNELPSTIGRCFILAGGARTAVNLGELAQRCCDHFGTPMPWVLPPQIVAPLGFLAKAPFVSRKNRRFVDQAQSYLPYFVSNPQFDVTATEHALSGSGIEVPRLETYIDTLLDYCLRQGWGKNSPMLRKSRHRKLRPTTCRAAEKRA